MTHTDTDGTNEPAAYRTLAPGQQAEVWVGGPEISATRARVPDRGDARRGAELVARRRAPCSSTAHGSLWRLDLTAPDAGLTAWTSSACRDLNNDHVLDPDGEHVYLSAMDGHIYRGRWRAAPSNGSPPTTGVWHFLHGVSPDGRRLAYVQIGDMAEPGQLAVLEAAGSGRIVDAGDGHLDGPEWSPDGQWIYLNTETFTSTPGHAQLARVPDGGGPVERLVTSDTVDWFPHLSPDARYATYISFPAGTLGHPADLDVEVIASSPPTTGPPRSRPTRFRRARNAQRQQLGTGQQPFRLRRVPRRPEGRDDRAWRSARRVRRQTGLRRGNHRQPVVPSRMAERCSMNSTPVERRRTA